ncbi:MAG: hypothetical protein LBG60_02665 [Bifidobacteriaceae bacterium]|nr:hypothetical protein [Bifidobacteriaceae bacterium]
MFRATLGVLVESVGLAAARRYPRLKEIDADSRAAGRAGDRAKSLSLADMTCLAHAWETGLPVLTGDRHWAALRPHGLPVDVFDFRDLSVLA